MNTLFESDVIRALWWYQPFASLMLPPYNKIETRTYPTKVRGKVLICVCKKNLTISELGEITGNEQYRKIVSSGLYGHAFHREHLGKAIAIDDLVDCRPMTKEDEDKCFVEYRQDRYCWIFDNVKPIEPFPIKGKQGWTILDEETKDKIKIL